MSMLQNPLQMGSSTRVTILITKFSSPVSLEQYAQSELWKHPRDNANETSLNASPAAGSSLRWGMSAVQ